MLIICEYCGNSFERSNGRVNEAIKMGWKQFCSSECLAKCRVTSISTKCANPLCQRRISRNPSQAAKSNLIFCSLNCCASYYNAFRQGSCLLRKCERVDCAKYIKNTNRSVRFCSKECGDADRTGFTSYTPASVLREIVNFVTREGRIPTRNELGRLNRLARRFFGTWNKAIEAAGFEPNPVMFAKHYVALDGHKCDSLAERIVDDWLYRRQIAHRIHVPYPWNNGMSADFVVSKYWIELFGLECEHKRYDELKRQKIALAKKYRVSIVPLSLRDVYKNGLNKKLASLSDWQRRPS